MKLFLVSLFILGSLNVFAQTKAEVKAALDQMQASGMFSAEQIAASKKMFNDMDDKEYTALIQKAKEQSQNPEVQKKAQELLKNYNGRVPAKN
ncbi:MAG: hypothetical protein HON90_07450 [Halobacteriovoraceae bacterium]|jgi:hypothetical protein|nr:hypothetical protein [Halobacteriovoraceae bacterium]